MVLTLVAEILSGDSVITPGGPVDAMTATGSDHPLWFPTPSDAPLDLVGRAVPAAALDPEVELEPTLR